MWPFRKKEKTGKTGKTEPAENQWNEEKLVEIARTAVDPKKYLDAVRKIKNQKTLIMIAQDAGGFKDSVRLEAIEKIEDPRALMKIALDSIALGRNVYSSVSAAAGRRFLKICGAAKFFPVAEELSSENQRIVTAAAFCRLQDNPGALKEALQNTENLEVARGMRFTTRDKAIEQICIDRANELILLETEKTAEAMTDEEKADFARDGSKQTGQRISMVKQITDDNTLAGILILSGRYDSEIRLAAAQGIQDSEILLQAAARLEDKRYREIYPVLIEKCSSYTPEFVLQDKRARTADWEWALDSVEDPELLKKVTGEKTYPESIRFKAAEKLGDQEVLADIALHGSDGSVRKNAVAAMTDKELLQRIGTECKNLRIRWCAAWRLGDKALIAAAESEAKERVNGHVVAVTVNIPWEHYEETCIRCGAVYGRFDDSESTRHYGKLFTSFPCRPDIRRLQDNT